MTSDILTLIQNGMVHFSKGQKLIANYIMNSYDKAAFMTASKLGKTVNVSESTVVRFAVELGYDGYPSMQRALQELERQGLMFSQRTSGRFVTEDREMIGKVREQIAGERITEFLSGMSQLGFTEQDIVAPLEKRSGEEKNNG